MRLGGAIKRFGMVTAGGGLGLAKGIGKSIVDAPKIGTNVVKSCADEVKSVWKSDISTISKIGRTAETGVAGLGLTALCSTANAVRTMTFGVLTGFETGHALADKGGKVELSKDQCVTTGADGVRVATTLHRDELGMAEKIQTRYTKPSTEFLQNDNIQGDNVQIHGAKNGNGPLLMLDSNTNGTQVNAWGRSISFGGSGR